MSNKMTKHLKVQWDIDDADEVQENYNCQNPREKICLCVWHVTNHLHWQMNLNKLSEEEHTELWWNYCGNIFRNRKEVDNHILEACKPVSSECTSKDEVKNYNGNIVVEKEDLIMKKCVENPEKKHDNRQTILWKWKVQKHE